MIRLPCRAERTNLKKQKLNDMINFHQINRTLELLVQWTVAIHLTVQLIIILINRRK